jgi:Na+/proline symporter
MRSVLIGFTALVLLFALNSEASIFKMVESAYKVTLVAAFVPLLAGLYWPRGTTQGAMLAIVGGLSTWLTLEGGATPDQVWPPQLVGLLVAAGGMVVGSLLPQWISNPATIEASAGHPSHAILVKSRTGTHRSH